MPCWMDAAEQKWIRKVFRLRGLPHGVTTYAEVADMLCSALGDIQVTDVCVASLAKAIEWEKPRSKVATLRFRSISSFFRSSLADDEWDLSVRTGLERLTLDCHFLGLTPLNEPGRKLHVADCIAISGLDSHPFGSWQPKGLDKDFMWIRDEAVSYFSGLRFITYGYDSSLISSTSTQSIRDIARDLIEHLRLGSWNNKSSKALVFLAHSLGGLVLKDALVQMADAMDNRNSCLLDKVLGMVMFGVPNLGMEQNYLRAMVEGQPNETLIEDLARNSNYLSQLDSSFSGICFERSIMIYWAYETRQTRTAIKNLNDGSWARIGPLATLVTASSATCRLEQKSSSLVFPINENHSDMVKFPRNNRHTRMVCRKLAQICGLDLLELSDNDEDEDSHDVTHRSAGQRVSLRKNVIKQKQHKTMDILECLDAPDLDLRISLIDLPYEGTLEWAFEQSALTNWLQSGWESGNEIFWISGKPGSGKSTLMKFIFQNERTHELLHDWKRGTAEVRAGFFFNYRGSAIQKSFEGLLRSVLRQIIISQPHLVEQLRPLFPNLEYEQNWTVQQLEQALILILKQTEAPLDIFLFFDALDEFGGHPNFISRFLRDLVQVSENSKTRVKVCFSSRPWDVFKVNFEGYPTLAVQDFTKTDIPQYCAGIIALSTPPVPILNELIQDIVEKAAGVFLWVKLVVADLLAAATSQEPKSANDMRTILEKLPVELDDYYEHIINRIPVAYRWGTYVLLELVIRAGELDHILNLRYVTRATAVSQCRTFKEVEDRLAQLGALPTDESGERLIRSRCGGLLEIQLDDFSHRQPTMRQNVVQVMHQTVFDFVTSLRCKSLILGNLAKITSENGHSFHFKYLCSRFDERLEDAMRHARLAEITTGQTQLGYIRSLPDNFYKTIWSGDGVTSAFGLTAHFNLVLCVRDQVQHPEWLQNIRDPLLFHCCAVREDSKFILDADRLDVMGLLLDNGYSIDREPTLFELILSWIVSPPLQYQSSLFLDPEKPKIYIKMAEKLLDIGQDPNRLCEGIFTPMMLAGDPPLHHAPLDLAKKLLDCNANPETSDELGYTALDRVLKMPWAEETIFYPIDTNKLVQEKFELASLLAERGVRLSTNGYKFCHPALRRMADAGFDTSWLAHRCDMMIGVSSLDQLREESMINELEGDIPAQSSRVQDRPMNSKHKAKWSIKKLFRHKRE